MKYELNLKKGKKEIELKGKKDLKSILNELNKMLK